MAEKGLPLLIIVIPVNLMNWVMGAIDHVNDVPECGLRCLLITVTPDHDDSPIGGIHALEQLKS